MAMVIVVVASIALVGGGSGSSHAKTAGQTAGLVRNATPQPDWKPHKGPVPILEYHVLGEAPPEAPYPELYVAKPDFRHQLEWLDRNGYEAVTLEQVEEAWYDGGVLPARPVVLSFDDGYRPQFTFALPQLRKHGWAGVLNLKAEGSDLYASNVRAMIDAGWEVASHTTDHSDLTTLDAGPLEEEVVGSRTILQREYGVPVTRLLLPGGEVRPDRDRRRRSGGLRRCDDGDRGIRRPRGPLRTRAVRDPRLQRHLRRRPGPGIGIRKRGLTAPFHTQNIATGGA